MEKTTHSHRKNNQINEKISIVLMFIEVILDKT